MIQIKATIYNGYNNFVSLDSGIASGNIPGFGCINIGVNHPSQLGGIMKCPLVSKIWIIRKSRPERYFMIKLGDGYFVVIRNRSKQSLVAGRFNVVFIKPDMEPSGEQPFGL